MFLTSKFIFEIIKLVIRVDREPADIEIKATAEAEIEKETEAEVKPEPYTRKEELKQTAIEVEADLITPVSVEAEVEA